MVRFPHPGEVRGIAWHPESKLLAAACADNDIYVWDVIKRTGQPRSILKGHEGSARWLAFNHAGDLLASTGWDGTVRLWDPWIGRQRVVSQGYDYPPQFSPDDTRLGIGLDRSHIGIWEVASGHECRILCGHEGPWVSPHTVDVSPDGRLLASAGGDGVRLWDLEPDGRSPSLKPPFASRLIFKETGKPSFRATQPACGAGRSMSIFGTGASACGPPRLRPSCKQARPLWLSRQSLGGCVRHRRSWPPAGSLSFPPSIPPNPPVALGPHPDIDTTAISADGRWVATSTWHGSSGNEGLGCRDRSAREGPGRDRRRYCLQPRWSPAGRRLRSRLSFLEDRHVAARLAAAPRSRFELRTVAFSADGRTLAIAHSNKLVRLLDAATGRFLVDLTAPDQRVITWMCFSPDESRLVVGGGNHLIHVWDLRRIRRQLADMGLDWKSPP